jgi:hypothetical protein|tara:strand:- start:161 stop:835 length:675 start_codon:yes stop_codon:yes gene_type:complete
MGYLNNATTVLDAVLTKKGRELLARGQNEFNITKFALADDEVDYSLWDVTHPLGTDYYGTVIEALPLLEPIPDPSTVMRYKLVTRAVGTNKMSTIQSVNTNYSVNWSSNNQPIGFQTITPSSTNLPNDETENYTFTLLNSAFAYLTSPNNQSAGGDGVGINYVESTQNLSQTVSGPSCTVRAKAILESAAPASTTLLITGQKYGATLATTVTVNFVDETGGNAG